jgi:hypothetical protein
MVHVAPTVSETSLNILDIRDALARGPQSTLESLSSHLLMKRRTSIYRNEYLSQLISQLLDVLKRTFQKERRCLFKRRGHLMSFSKGEEKARLKGELLNYTTELIVCYPLDK